VRLPAGYPKPWRARRLGRWHLREADEAEGGGVRQARQRPQHAVRVVGVVAWVAQPRGCCRGGCCWGGCCRGGWGCWGGCWGWGCPGGALDAVVADVARLLLLLLLVALAAGGVVAACVWRQLHCCRHHQLLDRLQQGRGLLRRLGPGRCSAGCRGQPACCRGLPGPGGGPPEGAGVQASGVGAGGRRRRRGGGRGGVGRGGVRRGGSGRRLGLGARLPLLPAGCAGSPTRLPAAGGAGGAAAARGLLGLEHRVAGHELAAKQAVLAAPAAAVAVPGALLAAVPALAVFGVAAPEHQAPRGC
jgi:hypothetical protein